MAGFARPVPVVPLTSLWEYADLVVECAPAAVLRQLAEPALAHGRQVMVLSCGALLDNFDLVEVARRHGGRILVPSGALLGLDAVTAAALGLVQGVVGGGEEVINGAAGLAGDGDADRDGDPYCRGAVPGDGELGDPLADPLGDLEGLGSCGAGKQQGEFLAAEPAAQVTVTQQVPHGSGDRGSMYAKAWCTVLSGQIKNRAPAFASFSADEIMRSPTPAQSSRSMRFMYSLSECVCIDTSG